MVCIAVKFNRPRDSCRVFKGMSSDGSVFLSSPLSSFALLNIFKASGETLRKAARREMRYERKCGEFVDRVMVCDGSNMAISRRILNNIGGI
jgi:cellulose synthase/poly-beta-1,6-N-acetylglucosamine synthase-like glycosyltransferase